MAAMIDIKPSADVIDVRDVIERYEDLAGSGLLDEDETEQFVTLGSLLRNLRGNGGDHKWDGAWYPDTLISDYYFTEYAKSFAETIGAVSTDLAWPEICIDWEKAASELQSDYSQVEYEGVTFWYR